MSRSPQRVLVCAAHPDDEVLGCGATIAKHARAGDSVHVLILAEGSTSRAQTRAEGDAAAVESLKTVARAANEVLGAASVDFAGFPDNRMDGIERLEVAKVVEQAVARHRPAIVYTHFPSDVNVDHGRVNEAVVVATRPTPGHPVRTVLFFEVPSSTEWRPAPGAHPFAPTWFVDVSETIDTKLAALREYATEMRPFPHPRSYEAVHHLARWRGATVGVAAAEAFCTGRHID
jgi:LmbE family N-acetylglucosaminyl deacetylase